MKKILISILICVFCFSASAQKNEHLRYDIECADNGMQGTYLVKVWVYTKKNKLSSDELKKYAVHGVIFKGFAGKGSCQGQRAMAQSPALEQERAGFFYPFFNNDRAYAKYATEVDGRIERIKIGKEYKYGTTISVSKDMLRKDLESAGIIRGLSDGF
jgi:hypothetical protein